MKASTLAILRTQLPLLTDAELLTLRAHIDTMILDRAVAAGKAAYIAATADPSKEEKLS